MKTTTRYTLALFTACTVLPAAGLLAQSPSPAMSATPAVSAPATTEEHEGGGMKAADKLTPEERQKLQAAHKAAMQDPAVKAAEAGKDGDKAAKKAYRMAIHDAMLKADPTIQPILDKMQEGGHGKHGHKKDL